MTSAPRPSKLGAFEALYEVTYRQVLAYAMRRTATTADAEEAASETYAIAWRRFDEIPAIAGLPWLYAIARRVIANQRRGNERRHRLGLVLSRQRAPVGVAAVGSGPAIAALVRLRTDDQELLRLVAWEELNHGEIAEVLGISANAVAIRLHRARNRFRAEFAIELPERPLKDSEADRTSLNVEVQSMSQLDRDRGR